jgi:hypothetical protein
LRAKLAVLESRLERQPPRANAVSPQDDRPPLLLTEIVAADTREPLLLDTPLPDATNDPVAYPVNRWPRVAAPDVASLASLARRHSAESLIGIAALALLTGPALAGGEPSPASFLVQVAAAASALAVSIWRRLAGALAATIAGLFWAFGAAVMNGAGTQALCLLMMAALGGAALGLRGTRSGTPVRPDRMLLRQHGPGVIVAVASALAFLPWLIASQSPSGAVDAPALASALLAALAAALVRARLAPAATVAAALLGMIFSVIAYLRARYPLAPGWDFYTATMLSTVIAVLAAGLSRPNHRTSAAIAGFGALTAAGLTVIAATTRADWHGFSSWGALVAGGALLFASAWAWSRRSADTTRDRSIDVWTIAGAVLILLGVEAALPEAARPLAHGLAALGFGYAATRIGWRGLRLAAIGAAATGLLAALAHADAGWLGIASVSAGSGAIWLGARALRLQGGAADWLVSLACLALAVGALATLAQIAAMARWDALVHNACRTLVLLGASLAIGRSRDAVGGVVGRWGSETLAAGGLAFALIGSGLVLNPWWGVAPVQVIGFFPFDTLTLAFAAPAALAIAASQRLRVRWVEALCKAAGAALALIWAMLEIRRGFHGAGLQDDAVGAVEGALYAILWLVGAVIFARLTRHRRDVQQFARLAGWVAVICAAATLLDSAHPWWGQETRGPAFIVALALHGVAAGSLCLLALENKEHKNALRFGALITVVALLWSIGHSTIHFMMAGGAERLAQSVWPLLLGLSLWALRQRSPYRETTSIAGALLWAGLGIAALGMLFVFNPWWGLQPAALGTAGAAITGLSAYAGASWLGLVAGNLRQAPGSYWLQRVGTATAAAHLLTLALLMVRRLHHIEMDEAVFARSELWAYAAVGLAFGVGSVWFGMRRNSALLRLGGLAALACATAYFFFLVITQLSGVAMAGALVSALAVLAACGWFASVYRPTLRPRRALFGR